MEKKKFDGGVKYDEGKARMDLVPPEAIFALGTILGDGAKKYEERNWERGMDWGRVYGACLRHLLAWWGGRGPVSRSFLFGDLDPETKRSHLWHAFACLSFLITYEERSIGNDTRLKHD
jgi:hypothetical protein